MRPHDSQLYFYYFFPLALLLRSSEFFFPAFVFLERKKRKTEKTRQRNKTRNAHEHTHNVVFLTGYDSLGLTLLFVACKKDTLETLVVVFLSTCKSAAT